MGSRRFLRSATYVFQRDDLSRGSVDVVSDDNVVLDVLQRQMVAVRRGDGKGVGLAVEGDTTGLVQMNMGASVEEYRVWRLGEVGANRELVGLSGAHTRSAVRCEAGGAAFRLSGGTHHGPADTEESGLLPSHRCHPFLEGCRVMVLLCRNARSASSASDANDAKLPRTPYTESPRLQAV